MTRTGEAKKQVFLLSLHGSKSLRGFGVVFFACSFLVPQNCDTFLHGSFVHLLALSSSSLKWKHSEVGTDIRWKEQGSFH